MASQAREAAGSRIGENRSGLMELERQVIELRSEIHENKKAAEAAHLDLGLKLEDVKKAIGEPAETLNGPTGIYKVLADLKGKFGRYEEIRHQWIGAAKVGGPMIVFFSGVIYWLERAQLERIFGLH